MAAVPDQRTGETKVSMRHRTLWLLVWGFCHQLACWRRRYGRLLTTQTLVLSAFKQRALDAALESGARVKGVAYIDDQGRLRAGDVLD